MDDVSLDDLDAQLHQVAVDTAFSGIFRIDDAERTVTKAYGFADRRFSVPNTPSTLFAIASGTKSITALAVLALIEDGVLSFDTTARSLLGDDLPLIDDRVTVEQLLTHRSGIGDYLDEGELEDNDYVLAIPVHRLGDANSYLAVLGGFPRWSGRFNRGPQPTASAMEWDSGCLPKAQPFRWREATRACLSGRPTTRCAAAL